MLGLQRGEVGAGGTRGCEGRGLAPVRVAAFVRCRARGLASRESHNRTKFSCFFFYSQCTNPTEVEQAAGFWAAGVCVHTGMLSGHRWERGAREGSSPSNCHTQLSPSSSPPRGSPSPCPHQENPGPFPSPWPCSQAQAPLMPTSPPHRVQLSTSQLHRLC